MKNDLLNRFSGQEGRKIVENLSRPDKAYIERAAQLNPTAVRVQTFDLSTAPTNPVKVGLPFKCAYVVAATDATATVTLKPFGDSENNDSVPMFLKDALNFDEPINACFINWTPQIGKTLTMVFFTDAAFDSGSQVIQGSTTPDGSTIGDFAAQTLISTSATLLDASARTVIVIQNEGPNDIYIGSSSVSAIGGSEIGLRVPSGTERRYRNTAPLYAAVNGSAVIRKQIEA